MRVLKSTTSNREVILETVLCKVDVTDLKWMSVWNVCAHRGSSVFAEASRKN